MSVPEFYDLRFINKAGATIPAHAIMQVDGWEESAGLGFFKVVKPTDEGAIYILNGPRDVASNKMSMATSALSHLGAFALFNDKDSDDQTVTPVKNEEWGPEPDSWYLKKGNSGFFIVGDIKGAAGSQPGFPITASTKRVRVSGAGGGGGGDEATAAGAFALIRGLVPAASDIIGISSPIVEGEPIITLGFLERDVSAFSYEGALKFGIDGLPAFRSRVVSLDPPVSERVPDVISVLNPSLTSFFGEGDGVAVAGTIVTVGEGEDAEQYFLLPTSEIRTRPGWALGTAPTGADDPFLSIVYTKGGSRDELADSADCAGA